METSWERRSNGPLLALSLRKEKVTDSVEVGRDRVRINIYRGGLIARWSMTPVTTLQSLAPASGDPWRHFSHICLVAVGGGTEPSRLQGLKYRAREGGGAHTVPGLMRAQPHCSVRWRLPGPPQHMVRSVPP